jgi:hypothetical protein
LLPNKKHTIVLALLIIFLLAAIVHLMLLRHKAGDIYPPYSSLRSDPLGAKIFYESLQSITQLNVSRNYRHLKKITHKNQFTLFYPGVHHEYVLWSDEINKSVEDMVQRGNRVVISFFPVTEEIKSGSDESSDNDSDSPSKNSGDKSAKDSADKSAKDSADKSADNSADKSAKDSADKSAKDSADKSAKDKKVVTFAEHFGFTVDFQTVSSKPYATCVVCEQGQQTLPQSVLMPAKLYFGNPDSSWRVIYARAGKPVLMERVIGKGSLVLCADSFFLSNEAMFQHRYPGLLAWLIGQQKEVIFDEQHHGIEETQGVATLAKKYHLQGLFAGFIILAALFIWKNSFPLIPRRDTISEAEISMHQDSAEGLIQLLTRNIPTQDILKVCFHEWKKSGAILTSLPEKSQEVERIIEEAHCKDEQSLLQTYKRINQILAERKFQWKKQ